MALNQDTLVRYKLWLQQKRGKNVAIQFWDARGKKTHVSIVAELPDISDALSDAISFQIGNDPRMTRAQLSLSFRGGRNLKTEGTVTTVNSSPSRAKLLSPDQPEDCRHGCQNDAGNHGCSLFPFRDDVVHDHRTATNREQLGAKQLRGWSIKSGDEICAWRNPAPVGQLAVERMLVWEA
jgi:hypothetical protein